MSVPTDEEDDFNDFLDGASEEHLAEQPGITAHDIDGQTWFEIELES